VARFIVRRLLVAIPVLFGLSVILFLFLRLLPGGGPAEAILGQHATPQLVAQIAASEGLDKPLYVQYFDYLGRLLHGDFGASFIDGREVAATFLIRFPATLELTIGALIFAVGLGIPLGRLAARHPNGWIDGIVTVISLFGISIPVFVLGYTLAFIFGVEFHLLPTFGQLDPRLPIEPVTHFALIDAILAGHWYVIDAVAHLILPSVALGTIPLAVFTRITRASVIEVSNEDYVRTARAKGLTDRRVNDRHIMRNAWLPVTTVIGLETGALLAGAVLTETVFSWNGVGSWVVSSIQNHDYIVVQSLILIFATIFLVVNLIVDVGYAFLNPRIRYS
jgi:ABC-type dipeptide/oligopeptide/nickel transport systems, permease components